jgi:hypothetical protein
VNPVLSFEIQPRLGSSVGSSPVVPDTGEAHRAVEKSLHTAGSRPVDGSGNQALLHALREEVAQALDLRTLTEDGNVGVAAGPHLVRPTHEATDLAGEVARQVRHEAREVTSVSGRHEQVEVVGEEEKAMDRHFEALGGPAEDTDDDSAKLGRGPKEETTLDSALGDLDDGARRDIA